jgi:hypothetical protein
MFYLNGNVEPRNAAELTAALEGAIRENIQLPAGQKIVTLTGEFPGFDSLAVDLSGGRIDPKRMPPKPNPVGPSKPGISAKTFSVTAKPLIVDASRVQVELTATDVDFSFDRDAQGRLLLMPKKIGNGRAAIEIAIAELRSVLLVQAKERATSQGVSIEKIDLTLRKLSDHAAAIEARITAKKGFFTGVVLVTGQIEIDSTMRAKLSNLDCRGENLTGNVAAGLLKGKLSQFNDRVIPLGEHVLAGVTLSDVQLESVDPLRITASFA